MQHALHKWLVDLATKARQTHYDAGIFNNGRVISRSNASGICCFHVVVGLKKNHRGNSVVLRLSSLLPGF
jgi:hypothetical protein